MKRSIVARYAERPVASFATVAPRASAPRLGLGRHVRFRTVGDRPTLLRRPERGPVALRRPDWRAVTPASPARATSGLAGPRGAVHWAKFGARTAGRRPRAATAPWRA